MSSSLLRRLTLSSITLFVVAGCECGAPPAEGEGEEGEGDGAEGEGDAGECDVDDDCEDADACTADRCDGGACVHPDALDGTPCGDDPCLGGAACLAGACTDGQAPDLDADDDGAFTAVCGGTDCDDNDALVGPLIDEGGPTCDDGKDNDCDGGADGLDVSCGGTEVCDTGWCWENPRPHGLPLSAVWASSPDDVWIGGQAGGLVHFDGERFTLDDVRVQGFPARVVHMWGSASDDVWATAGSGVIHWDGATWALDARLVGAAVADIWGFADDDIWTIGFNGAHHFDGVAWTRFDLQALGLTQLQAIHGSAPDDVWAVGGVGQAAHWDGSSWTAEPLPGPPPNAFLTGVAVIAPDDVWAAGDIAVMWHFDGTTWSSVPALPNRRFGRVAGVAGDDVWATGDGGLVAHWDGTAWSTALAAPTVGAFAGVRAFAADDVWAVGFGGIVAHWDGATWTRPNTPARPFDGNATDVAVIARPTSGHDVWAVGSNALGGSEVARRGDDGVWQSEPGVPATSFFVKLAASAVDDVWALGVGPTWHFDGDAWSERPAITQAGSFFNITDACVAGPDDVVVAGFDFSTDVASMLRFDGSAWVNEAVFTGEDGRAPAVAGVFCLAPDDVWAGSFEAVFHRAPPRAGEAAVWQRLGTRQIATDGITRVLPLAADDVRVLLGGDGFRSAPRMARFDGVDWVSVPLPRILTDDVEAFDLDGTGPTDLWLTSSAGLFHDAGDGFEPTGLGSGTDLATIRFVHARGVDDVLLTTAELDTFHWDGTSLTPLTGANDGIRGTAGRPAFLSDVDGWAPGGSFGELFHWDGVTWTEDNRMPLDAAAVFAIAADDVWVTDERTLKLAHFDGAAWTVVDFTNGGFSDERFVDVWGLAGDDVWAVSDFDQTNRGGRVWRNRGDGFVAVVTDTDVARRLAVRGRSADDVWVFGAAGDDDVALLERFDGAAFSTYRTLENPVQVQRVGGRTLAFTNDRALWERTTAGWQELVASPDPDVRGAQIASAHFVSADELWFIDGAGAQRFVDGAFVSATPSTGLPGRVLAGSGVDGDDALWAVGAAGAILRH